MSKPWKPAKNAVELRPSRIRREPPPPEKPSVIDKKLQWESGEREIWFAVIGIVGFGVAIDIIIMAISAYWQ